MSNLRTQLKKRNENRPESSGSRTLTINSTEGSATSEPLVLNLQPNSEDNEEVEQNNGPRVRFDDSVIDNEHMNRKKSKICCIYRKQFNFDESSDESSREDEEADDEQIYQGKNIGSPNAYEKQPKYNRKKKGCNH